MRQLLDESPRSLAAGPLARPPNTCASTAAISTGGPSRPHQHLATRAVRPDTKQPPWSMSGGEDDPPALTNTGALIVHTPATCESPRVHGVQPRNQTWPQRAFSAATPQRAACQHCVCLTQRTAALRSKSPLAPSTVTMGTRIDHCGCAVPARGAALHAPAHSDRAVCEHCRRCDPY